MSIYDNRLEVAYGFSINPSYANNKYILEWWLTEYDQYLKEQILEWGWVWSLGITKIIVNVVPENKITKWRSQDPLCSQYAWYNILSGFAVSRALSIGLLDNMRKPVTKNCLICSLKFVENSLPYPLIKRLGLNSLNYCAPCLREIILPGHGDQASDKTQVIEYVNTIALLIDRVPTQGFGEKIGDLIDFDAEKLDQIMHVLVKKPSTDHVLALFGSWLNALVQSGVLENGARKTARGIQTIARDGHVCLSLGEKTSNRSRTLLN